MRSNPFEKPIGLYHPDCTKASATTSATANKQDEGKGGSTATPVTTTPAAASSTAANRARASSDSSKNDSCLLTEEARKKYHDAFESMNDDQKWLLKPNKQSKKIHVEDIMYERGEKLEYEQ